MSCVWYYCSGLEIFITECTSWKRVNLLHPGLPLHLFHLGTSHCLSPEGEGGGGEGMLYSYKAPFPCTILTPSIHPEKSPPTLSTLCLSCKQLFTVNVSFKWTTISCLLSGRPSFLSNLRNPGRMVPQQKPGDTVPIINTWSLFLFPPGNPWVKAP